MSTTGFKVNIKSFIHHVKNRMTYTFKIDNVYIALFSEKNNDGYEFSAYMFGEGGKNKIVQHKCVVLDACEIRELFKKIYKECPNLLISRKVPA